MPDGVFTCALDKCNVLKSGSDVTVVSWGSPLHQIAKHAESLERSGISCEVIDLSSIYPIDYKTIEEVSLLA